MGVLAGSKALEKAGIIAYDKFSLDKFEVFGEVSRLLLPHLFGGTCTLCVVEILLRGRLLITPSYWRHPRDL